MDLLSLNIHNPMSNTRQPFSSTILSALAPVGGVDSNGKTQTIHSSPTQEGEGLIVSNKEILDKLDTLIQIQVEIRDLLLNFK